METQVELTDEQTERLRDLARSEETSVRELIARAVEDLLRRSRGETARGGSRLAPEQRERALSVSGRYHGAPTDLAANHDKCLAEDFGR